MSSPHTTEPYRYSDDDREAREQYNRARADPADTKRPGTPGIRSWAAFKSSTYYWRLVSAFDQGIHNGTVVLDTQDGVLLRCTCGLLCEDDAELERSNGHRDMGSWEVGDVVILRVRKGADERSVAEPYVARCQRCGQRSPVDELGAAKYWRTMHRCEVSTAAASRLEAAGSDEPGTGDRS